MNWNAYLVSDKYGELNLTELQINSILTECFGLSHGLEEPPLLPLDLFLLSPLIFHLLILLSFFLSLFLHITRCIRAKEDYK
jgi:hypothetical protein